jgi:hypothetical protein
METRLDSLTMLIRRNRRLEIDPGSIRVVHELEDRGRWVVAAEFDGYGPLAAAPRRRRTTTYQGLYALRPTEVRWHLAGSSVGARGASAGRSAVWSRMGGFSTTGFGSVRGGWVADPAGRLVRLTDDAGRTVDGGVEAGVALLSWPEDGFGEPARTDLLDADGRVLASDVSAAQSTGASG